MELSGFVLDQNTYPLAGASVQVEGLGVGTVSGPDGSFYLNDLAITGASWILISYIGYVTARVSADFINRQNMAGDDAAIQLQLAAPVTLPPVVVTTTPGATPPKTAGFDINQWWLWGLVGLIAYKAWFQKKR